MDLDAFEQTSFLATDAAPASSPGKAIAAPVNSSHPRIEFGAYLRELCAEIASLFGSETGVTITCTATEGFLPTTTAIRLGLIAEDLIKDTLEHAFPGGRGGRIAVTFGVESGAWRLMVEDSGLDLRAAAGDRRGGMRLVHDLAAELGGRLKISGLVGGTRCIVVGPPPRARPCSMLREGEVSRYLELTRPLRPTSRAGEEGGAIVKRGGAARRRLAASIALGWLTVEEALDDTPLGPSFMHSERSQNKFD